MTQLQRDLYLLLRKYAGPKHTLVGTNDVAIDIFNALCPFECDMTSDDRELLEFLLVGPKKDKDAVKIIDKILENNEMK